MKFYNKLKAAIEVIEQMVEVTESESKRALKQVKRLRKEFDFIAPMSKGPLAKGQKA